MEKKGIINSINLNSVENLSITELETRFEFSFIPGPDVHVCANIFCDGILCDGIVCDKICDCVSAVCDQICDQICGQVCDQIW